MAGLQINIGDHVSPMAGYVAFPNDKRDAVRWARRKARWIAANKADANPAFSALPGGRTLTQILADNTIWVNYHATLGYFGETNMVGGKEVAIGVRAHNIGRWTVLATLIHELAHTNGAPGGASPLAERVLIACGLGHQHEQDTGVDDPSTPFDPGILGSLQQQASSQEQRYA